jgi:hypothetical protein
MGGSLNRLLLPLQTKSILPARRLSHPQRCHSPENLAISQDIFIDLQFQMLDSPAISNFS